MGQGSTDLLVHKSIVSFNHTVGLGMVGRGCDQGDVELLAVLTEGAAGQVQVIVHYDDGRDAEM